MIPVHHAVLLAGGALQTVTPAPPSSISNGVQTILQWLMWGALVLCGASALISGGVMAFGHHSSRPDLAVRAKTGLLWALAGAFLIGVSIPLVNLFFGLAIG